jgi:hypothetical protein
MISLIWKFCSSSKAADMTWAAQGRVGTLKDDPGKD